MWNTEKVEFMQLVIGGKDFDPEEMEVTAIIPQKAEPPYWEIIFEYGSKMVTTEKITFQFKPREIGK